LLRRLCNDARNRLFVLQQYGHDSLPLGGPCRLSTLDAADNPLHGTLPPAAHVVPGSNGGPLRELLRLRLAGCGLSGTLPAGWPAALPLLEMLGLEK
jgi:hypothetical protein